MVRHPSRPEGASACRTGGRRVLGSRIQHGFSKPGVGRRVLEAPETGPQPDSGPPGSPRRSGPRGAEAMLLKTFRVLEAPAATVDARTREAAEAVQIVDPGGLRLFAG